MIDVRERAREERKLMRCDVYSGKRIGMDIEGAKYDLGYLAALFGQLDEARSLVPVRSGQFNIAGFGQLSDVLAKVRSL